MNNNISVKTYEKLLKCVHCGYCLQHCPIYKQTNIESSSSRGRIALMKSYAEDQISLRKEFRNKMDLCLQCRSCETDCPAGVNYAELMEEYKSIIFEETGKSIIMLFVLRHLFPFPSRMRAFVKILYLYQKSGIHFLIKKTNILGLLSKTLEIMNYMLPKIPSRFFKTAGLILTKQEKIGKVAFFTGCINPLFFPEVNHSTISVLAKNGYDIIIPSSQNCCGALHVHTGDKKTAVKLAKANIDAFSDIKDISAIITNAAGCGSTMKEYKNLFSDNDPYKNKAEIFCSKVKDITEFLAEAGLKANFRSINANITFQDPCHLYHAQKIKDQPRLLLSKIPGVNLTELKDAELCCGSAGIYNITNTELSMLLLDEKLKRIIETKATILLTANPGCMIQLKYGIAKNSLPITVKHIIEFIDEAMVK